MKLTFVSSVGKSSENTDVVGARFADLTPHKRTDLSIQFLSEAPTTASRVDSSVRDTYRGLLGLPVPERFIELVQSYPDQQETDSGNRNCGSHAPLLHRCSE